MDFYGSPDTDQIVGTESDDRIWGFGGDDLIIGRNGADYMDGGGGVHIIDYRCSNGGWRINLDLEIAISLTGPTIETIRHFEWVQGSLGSDMILGNGKRTRWTASAETTFCAAEPE